MNEETNKCWNEQKKVEDYRYLRLGDKVLKHIIFELSPQNDLNILIGEMDICLHRVGISESGKKMLKIWVNNFL